MLEVQMKKRLSHFLLEVKLKAENEILVVVGPSGAGKTTLLNIIAGIDIPDAGSITLNGLPYFHEKSQSLPSRKRKIGYLFQDYALFPHMTVEANIAYGVKRKIDREAPSRIGQLVKLFGIEHLIKKYPHQISGGEKQRVALARALATEPCILLLDEPLSALDYETRLACQDELIRLHKIWKIPFIIVTHDKVEAKKLGDRIIFLERGSVVVSKPDSVFSKV